MCDQLRSHGIPPDALLKEAGLTTVDLRGPDARIKVQSQIRFLELAARAIDDDLLGFHVAEQFDLRELGLLYYILASSNSLSETIRNAARYSRITNEGMILHVKEREESTSIMFQYAGVRRIADRHQMEFIMTMFLRICRKLTDRRFVPQDVRVNHHRGTPTSEIDAFFGRKVQFGADVDVVVLSRRDHNSVVVSADPYLHELLKHNCEEALSARKAKHYGLRYEVENIIGPIITDGRVNADAVAQKVGMSTRTMIRRLADEGCSFSELLSGLRFDLAKRYLEDESLSISQIAWFLGYSEVSSFTHSFQRWSGSTPRQWRSLSPAEHEGVRIALESERAALALLSTRKGR